jgi:hypothetical protein
LYDGRWWLHPDYRFNYASFLPKQMTPDELTKATFSLRSKFNSNMSIAKRALDFKTNLRTPIKFGMYITYNPLYRKETFKNRVCILAKNHNSFFRVYQYISPLVLTPLSFWLWNNTYNGNLVLVLMAWLVPILFAYIVPGVGTNILGVWEFNTKFRLGKFRPHHGFVFGSATSIIIWVCHRHIAHDLMDVVVFGIVAATVLGSVNFFMISRQLNLGF